MSTEAPTQRYRLDPHARFRVLDDEGIFVLQEAGEVLVVNEVGAFIVERLQREQTLHEVVAAVTERYAVETTTAQADAESLLHALVEAGAIVRT